jgi:predicted ester cyclase
MQTVSDEADLRAKANQLDRIFASRNPVEIANKAIIARYVQATNVGDLDVLDELVYDDYVEHTPVPGQGPGLAGLKDSYRMFNGPFPDVQFVFDDVIAEGDLVVGRGVISGTHEGEFFGIPATNKKVRWTGTRLFRLRDLKVVEGWAQIDMLGLMQQMGVVPTPPGPQPERAPSPNGLNGRPMGREANRKLLVRFVDEVWNKGNLEVADELFHPDASSPSAPGLPNGPAGVKEIASVFRNAFPDYWLRIEDVVAEDDRIAARFTQGGTHEGDLFGVPATGKEVEWGEIGILRTADGKVVESWYDVDLLGLMGQLGVGSESAAPA